MITDKQDKGYIAADMPKSPETARHEVHLDKDVVKDLKEIADQQNRSLKNLMETVLIEYAKVNKPTKKGKS